MFVILDDKGARWYSYSFDKYLSGEDAAGDKQDRAKRTRNLILRLLFPFEEQSGGHRPRQRSR